MYYRLLPLVLFFEVWGRLIAPFLPLFAKMQYGKIDNGNDVGFEPRLKDGSYFMTTDNSLWGDKGWQTKHCPYYKSYWGQVRWLLRNCAYGFKWQKVSCEVIPQDLSWAGDLLINRNDGGRFGKLKITMGKYWQWKYVKRIPFTDRCIMFNFGWLLDTYCRDPELIKTQPKALFLFSPRILLKIRPK